MKSSVKFFILISFFVLAACSSSSGSGSNNSQGTALAGLAACEAQSGSAVICGIVYAADGTTPVANATLTRLDSSSNITVPIKNLSYADNNLTLSADTTACKTDDVGAFACQVDNCSGTATFQISGSLFGTALEFTATCTEDEVTNVPTTSTTATSTQTASVKWLVIPGSFDGIQLLLSQLKGCTLTGDTSDPASLRGSTACENAGLKVLDDSEVSTFLSTETLSAYQAIFVNCSADYSDGSTITTALQNYVNNGGNAYFSDLSDDWLTADFPNLITFPANKNSTSSGTLENMTVDSPALQTFLGTTTMNILFDFGVWTAIESVIDTWTTYVSGDISPLAPTLTGVRPITVGGPKDNGCIFYTSYHVEAGSPGDPQETALKYLVLNKMSNCE